MRVNKRRMTGIFLAILVIALSLSPSVRSLLCLPETARLVVGEKIFIALPLHDKILNRCYQGFGMLGEELHSSGLAVSVTRYQGGYQLTALRPGRADIKVRFLGFIPIKSIQVESLPSCKVVAGGHSIGVLMESKGIMVVGFAPLLTDSGLKICPAKEAGVEIGDLILKVDGHPVFSESELARVIDEDGKSGRTVRFLIKREHHTKTYNIKPIYCSDSGRYRVGLYVRDGVAGVGTLTFWDPISSGFAALGHVIMDTDTRQVINPRQGRIVTAAVQTIQPGRPGRPGQKIGVFDRDGEVSGRIISNSNFGVFGVTDRAIHNDLLFRSLSVAYAHQVKKGPAQILTVVNGTQIESFQVIIEKVYPWRHNGKGMVIRISDPRLLTVSGGIVQGMSGSPIIQNGRIVGAVTHVLLNNPQKGYGVFMDSMIETLIFLKENGFYRQIAQ